MWKRGLRYSSVPESSPVSCEPQSSKGRGASVLWWGPHKAGVWGGAGTGRKAHAVFPDPSRTNWLDPSVPRPTSVLKRRGCVGSLGTSEGKPSAEQVLSRRGTDPFGVRGFCFPLVGGKGQRLRPYLPGTESGSDPLPVFTHPGDSGEAEAAPPLSASSACGSLGPLAPGAGPAPGSCGARRTQLPGSQTAPPRQPGDQTVLASPPTRSHLPGSEAGS